MRIIALLIIASMYITACGRSTNSQLVGSEDVSNLRYVRVPVAMLNKEWVAKNNFNRDHAKDAVFALGWMTQENLNALTHEEKASITILDEYKVARGVLNPFTLSESPLKFFDLDQGAAENYHDYAALTTELTELANTYSEIAQVDSIGKSNQGRELWLMRITGVTSSQRKPKLLYIANMHGDEVVGRELSIYQIRRLLSEYGKDTRVTNLVNNSEIFIIPSMNPDGFESKRRYNSKGVDLNRDFPDFTSDNQDNAHGRAIETSHIMDLHSQHHFVSALNFHGGEVCFNLPWDTQPNRGNTKFGDDALIHGMGRAYADSNKTMRANNNFDKGLTYGYEWYEVDGGLQDWSIYYRNSLHATVELSYAKWPSATYLPTAWEENKEALLTYLERSLKGIHIEAVDTDGNPVQGISVRVNSSSRPVHFADSYGSRTTSEPIQIVTVQSQGYRPVNLAMTPRTFDGTYHRVVLTR